MTNGKRGLKSLLALGGADHDSPITNLCRRSTYHRIRQAIHLSARLMRR